MLVCDRFSRRACHATSRTLLCLQCMGLVEQGEQGGRWSTLQWQIRSHLGGQFHLLAKEKPGIPTLTVWQSEAADDEQSDNTMVTHQCTCKYKPLTSIAVILESEFNCVPMGFPTISVMNAQGPVVATCPPVPRKMICFKSRAKCVSSPR